jgi:copper chaperone CopZ
MSARIDFTVTGKEKMHCSGCESRIRFALQRLAGVQHVAADAHTQRVTVAFDPDQVTSDQLRERLDLMGFEVEVKS